MPVSVKIPTQLRSVTGGDSETAVGEVLDGPYESYDGLRERVAEDGDEVTILPAVAGSR